MTASRIPRACPTDGFERYVAEVVAIGGTLSTIADHMTRNGGTSESIPAILDELFRGALAELREGVGDALLDDAATLLRTTNDRVCAEILLVPLNRAEGRAARRRPACG